MGSSDGTKKLALGTVQFGLPYGVANQQGQVSAKEAKCILEHAQAQGINTLDTAIAYGNSEEALGLIGINDWKVISKLPALPDQCEDVRAWVEEQVVSSLQRLGVSHLEGLLLHRPDHLLLPVKGKALYQALCDLKATGQVRKIGISIYRPTELDELALSYPSFDLVQAPLNIIDRSLINSGWLKKLHVSGTEIHVRSTFLQGLLLMPINKRPEKFSPWQSLWQQWDAWLGDNHITALEACLLYTLSFPEIAKVVVGIDSLTQLQQIVKATSKTTVPCPPDTLQSKDPQLINPALWGNL